MLELAKSTPSEMVVDAYRDLGFSYPKFFKMDVASKAAFVAAEMLHHKYKPSSAAADTAIILATKTGCLSVDRKFNASRAEVASPALFVYTLPNIMLGELSIRFGYKGEQLCMPLLVYDFNSQLIFAETLFECTDTKEILMGYVNADDEDLDLLVFWVSRESTANSSALEPESIDLMQLI